jgi:hypothetical protein
MFGLHPLLATYPGASFTRSHPYDNGNVTGPHLAAASGGNSMGYWGHVPWEVPSPPEWGLPPAVVAAMEGRGTGVYGVTGSGGAPYNYGWPKYGPVRGFSLWLRFSLICSPRGSLVTSGRTPG